MRTSTKNNTNENPFLPYFSKSMIFGLLGMCSMLSLFYVTESYLRPVLIELFK